MLGVVEEILTALEAVVEDWVAPWGKDCDGGLQCVECELETNLIIALACAAVGHSEAAFLLGNLDLGAGNDWTSKGCA